MTLHRPMLCWALLAAAVAGHAGEAIAPLLPFDSDAGLARFAQSAARADFPALANQYEPQWNTVFCGPTTAAIVLNALDAGDAGRPRDHARLQPDDLRFLPAGRDPVVARYTPDGVITRGGKSRARVLGEPVAVDGKPVADFGYQLRQFDELMRAHGAQTLMVIVDDSVSDGKVHADLVANLQRRGDYVVVNYSRKAVGQTGGGHISPLGAYDAASDSFLVLDVNPAAAGWVWLPAATLINGMRTFDTVENRGYVLVGGRSGASED